MWEPADLARLHTAFLDDDYAGGVTLKSRHAVAMPEVFDAEPFTVDRGSELLRQGYSYVMRLDTLRRLPTEAQLISRFVTKFHRSEGVNGDNNLYVR